MRSHAGVNSYVMANQRIIRDAVYVDSPLESLDICILGESEAQVELRIYDETIWEGKIKGQQSFREQLKDMNDVELTVRIVDINDERLYRLYLGTQPLIRHRDIDQLAFELFFRPLNEGADPQFDRFKAEVKRLDLVPLEELYMNSLYDYALGFSLAKNGKPQRGHFESALYGLSRFRTDFAVAGQRVLALRMNCFGLLSDCTPTSRFFMAAIFFCNPFNVDHEARTVNIFDSEYGVYVDSLTLSFLDAINAYYAAEPKIFNDILKGLWSRVADYETNSHVKISILGARYWRRLGDKNRARDNYDKLLNDPDFAKEARDFLT